MSRNFEEKLLQKIMTGNYQLVYQWRGKCGNYRDTGVSKNINLNTLWCINFENVFSYFLGKFCRILDNAFAISYKLLWKIYFTNFTGGKALYWSKIIRWNYYKPFTSPLFFVCIVLSCTLQSTYTLDNI